MREEGRLRGIKINKFKIEGSEIDIWWGRDGWMDGERGESREGLKVSVRNKGRERDEEGRAEIGWDREWGKLESTEREIINEEEEHALHTPY